MSHRITALALLDNERKRQIEEEGHSFSNDRGRWKELARAAASYALIRASGWIDIRTIWPWHDKFWKPDPQATTEAAIHDLKRSGALILAALEDLLAQQAAENERTYLYIGSSPRATAWGRDRGIPRERIIVLNGAVSAREKLLGLKERVTLVDGGESTLSYRDVEAIFQLKAQLQGDNWREVRAAVS